ncbi:hypothetical protein NVIRENTERO_01696 [Sodalis praecaptivus]|nr:hypothetical protein NVIRENTERO_01696 [Sodalis praecaptivus]
MRHHGLRLNSDALLVTEFCDNEIGFLLSLYVPPESPSGVQIGSKSRGQAQTRVTGHTKDVTILALEKKNATFSRGATRVFVTYERFIMSKNSSLVLVIANLFIRNSIASISPIGWMILRKIHIFCSSS